MTGFHPLTGRNEKIVNNVLPSDSDISKLICTHPESKCLNVPLSICSLIQHANQTGASDHNLLQIILMFLKKHCPQTYFTVNPKKSNLRSLISALTLYCNCEDQINLIKWSSTNLLGIQANSSQNALARSTHFSQFFTCLGNQSRKIRKIQSIAPYLVEQKTAKVFGNWIQESILLKRDVTKQQIIETVHKLEQNSALKLSSTKNIPSHFAQTQLGLIIGSDSTFKCTCPSNPPTPALTKVS